MTNKKVNIDIPRPIHQLNLYGYKKNFSTFKDLLNRKSLPNVILINGPKGIGKATFVYHFINYLLSLNEDHNYSLSNFKINPNNKSYKLTLNNSHPNFFLLENLPDKENIKIEQVRSLINFLNKTTYLNNVKIVLIDGAENLNINSSNALLKALEEPSPNTFFFIINNNSNKILNTIKSRCIEFKFFLNVEEKKIIFNYLKNEHNFTIDNDVLDKFLYFDSPGNLLNYIKIFDYADLNLSKDFLSCIFYLIDNHKSNLDINFLDFASLFLEIYFNDLIQKEEKNFNYLLLYKSKLINQINDMKKFNLDKKNLLISIKYLLDNEKK